MADVQRLAFAADEFCGVHERWPSHDELLELDPTLARRDIWDQEFTFEQLPDGGLRVRSPGMDEELHTADDIVSWTVYGGEQFREWLDHRARPTR